MICALDQHEHTLYFTTNAGDLIHLDTRNPASTIQSTNISDRKVCSVHVNPTNHHYLSTSGLDRSWNVWDSRKLKSPVASFNHNKSCTSAYWSSCGQQLVSTSFDDTVQVFEGVLGSDWQENAKHCIKHNNQTGKV